MSDARFMNNAPAPARPGGTAAAAAALGPWFHNLHLPDGSQTAPAHPLGDFPTVMWQQFASHLPDRLEGWQVLDVGCNSGFYSIELARRGARVTAIDADPHFVRQARWAVDQFGFNASVEVRQAQVYELAHGRERFDLVLFLGVFYHLRYPLLALDLLAEKTRQLMVFQTLSLPGEEVESVPEDQDFDDRSAMLRPGWPHLAFIEHRLAGDPTNWWTPNRAAIEAMLRSTGLRIVARPHAQTYVCAPAGEDGRLSRTWDQAELHAATGQLLPRSTA